MLKLILFIILIYAAALGQTMEVPVDVQVTLFKKIAGYDNNLSNKTAGKVVIGVVYQKKNKTSEEVKDQFINAFNNNSEGLLSGIPVSCVPIDLTASSDPASLLNDANMMYITPLRAFDVKLLTSLAKNKKISTFTGVEEYIDMGVSTCIASKGGKPIIKISLPASKEEGIDYKAVLLKIAEVVQ